MIKFAFDTLTSALTHLNHKRKKALYLWSTCMAIVYSIICLILYFILEQQIGIRASTGITLYMFIAGQALILLVVADRMRSYKKPLMSPLRTAQDIIEVIMKKEYRPFIYGLSILAIISLIVPKLRKENR